MTTLRERAYKKGFTLRKICRDLGVDPDRIEFIEKELEERKILDRAMASLYEEELRVLKSRAERMGYKFVVDHADFLLKKLEEKEKGLREENPGKLAPLRTAITNTKKKIYYHLQRKLGAVAMGNPEMKVSDFLFKITGKYNPEVQEVENYGKGIVLYACGRDYYLVAPYYKIDKGNTYFLGERVVGWWQVPEDEDEDNSGS